MTQGNNRMMQTGADAEPVVEDATLPTMDTEPDEGAMAEQAAASPKELMSDPPPEIDEEAEAYPEMEPRKDVSGAGGPDAASFAAERYGDGYLRLLVEVEDEHMSVTDAAVVAGPVAQPDLTGDLIYEVVLDGRQVAAEGLPELAFSRSLAPPDEPEKGHSIKPMKRFDFVVRIPRAEVTQDELKRVQVELVRPEQTTQVSEMVQQRPGVPFAQMAAEAAAPAPKVIARLDGIDIDSLSPKAASAVREGLR